MTKTCYRCDRHFNTNYKLDKTNWICKDCSRDIMIVQGWEFKETPQELEARMERKAYWENKK